MIWSRWGPCDGRCGLLELDILEEFPEPGGSNFEGNDKLGWLLCFFPSSFPTEATARSTGLVLVDDGLGGLGPTNVLHADSCCSGSSSHTPGSRRALKLRHGRRVGGRIFAVFRVRDLTVGLSLATSP